ncbi:MAG: zf-HC2 domain-containing protein [Acidobacteria bacterium]|nr:zf-HC2 domain-containing protein [Acidobacteriota bacterium]
MICDLEKIYLYLDQELSEPERAEMDAHLRECAACADLLRAERAILEDLDGLSDVAAPAWLEREIIERAHDDLTATFQSRAERRRALTVVGALSFTAAVLLSFNTIVGYLREFLMGLRVGGSVLWNIATVFLKGLSFVTVGMVHGLADDAQVTPLPAFLLAAMLSLVLVRLVMHFEVSTNKR